VGLITEIRLQLLCAWIGLLTLGLSYMTLGGRPSRDPEAAAQNTQSLAEEEEVNGPWTPEEAISIAPKLRDWKGITVHHTAVVTSPEHLALSHIKRGFKGLAYHFLILGPDSECDGCVFVSRRWSDQQPVPQTRDQRTNRTTVAVAVMGDFDSRDPSARQFAALDAILKALLKQLELQPSSIRGHGERSPSQCPGHRLNLWLRVRVVPGTELKPLSTGGGSPQLKREGSKD
jgi:hypothetical protein